MGWVYNLDGTDSNSTIGEVIAISLAFSIFSLLAVALRFYVRTRRLKNVPWYDDYAALVSSLLTIAYASVTVYQTRWGLGLSAAYFPDKNVIPFSRTQYIGGPLYCLGVLGFKLALLTSYLRFAGVVKIYRKVILAAIILSVVNQLIFAILISVSCVPVAKQWDSSIKGKCINTQPFYFALGGTSIGFDLIIIALPLPVLWKLQLRSKEKAFLAALFTLGFFVTVVQVVRIFTVQDLKTYTDSKRIIIWSVVEMSLGVIISCIPTYAPLIKGAASAVKSYPKRSMPSYQLGSRSHHMGRKSTSRSKFDMISDPSERSTTVIGSGSRKPTQDGDSEEHILSENKVYVTSEVSVREG